MRWHAVRNWHGAGVIALVLSSLGASALMWTVPSSTTFFVVAGGDLALTAAIFGLWWKCDGKCPLTELQKKLMREAGMEPFPGGFIAYYGSALLGITLPRRFDLYLAAFLSLAPLVVAALVLGYPVP